MPIAALSATNSDTDDFKFRFMIEDRSVPVTDLKSDMFAFEDPCDPSKSLVPKFPWPISNGDFVAEVHAEDQARAARSFALNVSVTLFTNNTDLEGAAWRAADSLCLVQNRVVSGFWPLGLGGEKWIHRFSVQCSGERSPMKEFC